MTLQEACQQIGIEYRIVSADGKLHSVPVLGKGSKNTAGRIKLFTDGIGGVVMNNIESSVMTFWNDDTATAISGINQAERAARLARERQELEESRRVCREESRNLWENVAQHDTPAKHPYLIAKGIRPYGARYQKSGELIVLPVMDIDDTMHGLQFISPDGGKKFKTATSKIGNFHRIPGNEQIIICEGYATGASIHEATGATVIVAFDAGNLSPVTAAVRGRFPDAQITIAADNDIDRADNPGRSKATKAAVETGVQLAVVNFSADQVDTFRNLHGGKAPTDYNDLHQMAGLEVVATQIRNERNIAPVKLWPDFIDLLQLAEHEPMPPRFIIPGWLPCGYATMLSGHGGAGKSTISLILIVCMALGYNFFGNPVEQRTVLFLSCEDRIQIIHWRLHHICRFLGVSIAELYKHLFILDLVGHENIIYQPNRKDSPLTPIYHELSQKMNACKAQVLVVDGISDTYDGNENSRAEPKAFVNSLLSLVPAEDGAVLLLGHVAKSSATNVQTNEGYSGSTAWHNAVRARWYLYPETKTGYNGRPEATGKLILELQKSNLGKADQSMCFEWDDNAHMFSHVQVAEESHFDKNYRETQERDAVIKAIVNCPVDIPAATTGQRTALHVLASYPDFPFSSDAGRPEKRRFWDHIEKLRGMRLVAEDYITRADYHKVRVLVATDLARSGTVDTGNVAKTHSPDITVSRQYGDTGNPVGGIYKGGAGGDFGQPSMIFTEAECEVIS